MVVDITSEEFDILLSLELVKRKSNLADIYDAIYDSINAQEDVPTIATALDAYLEQNKKGLPIDERRN